MFVVDRTRELVGYVDWTWDRLYTPLVGCYREGHLVKAAVCELPEQPVGLAAPPDARWFRMRVDTDVREALLDRDPAVRVMQMEDGLPIDYAGTELHTPRPPREWPIERFLFSSSQQSMRLDGFPAFLAAPLLHQLDILFLDVLNRLPDPEARNHYMQRLEAGETILAIRRLLIESEEFAARRLTVSNRIGALMTSSVWMALAAAEPVGERRRPLRRIRMVDYAELTDEEFARQIHIDVHGDEPSEIARGNFVSTAQALGRREVAVMLVRAAATVGRLMVVADR